MTAGIPGISPQALWVRHREPFHHIRAEDVFEPDTYNRLTAEFQEVLKNTRDGRTQALVFRPPSNNYDAMICGLDARGAARFYPLFEQSWLEHLASLDGLGDPRVVDAALHHVPRGSRSGYIHTDFCSAWFDRSNENDTPRFPVRTLTDYFSGFPRSPEARPVEYIRVLTMIYYLANDGWKNGDGGETGLFSSVSGKGQRALCPPKNNSLLVFECSPHSFHALQGNAGRDRNSVILWLHSEVARVQERWPVGMKRRKYL